jgi:hypothetical protein
MVELHKKNATTDLGYRGIVESDRNGRVKGTRDPVPLRNADLSLSVAAVSEAESFLFSSWSRLMVVR